MTAMKALFGLLTFVDPTVEIENERRESEDAKASLLLKRNRMAERMRDNNTFAMGVGRLLIRRLIRVTTLTALSTQVSRAKRRSQLRFRPRFDSLGRGLMNLEGTAVEISHRPDIDPLAAYRSI
jgi:hypothetical protein